MATHPSILACRIPWTEEPGGLYSPRGRKTQTQLSDQPTTISLQAHSVFTSPLDCPLLAAQDCWLTSLLHHHWLQNREGPTAGAQNKGKSQEILLRTPRELLFPRVSASVGRPTGPEGARPAASQGPRPTLPACHLWAQPCLPN